MKKLFYTPTLLALFVTVLCFSGVVYADDRPTVEEQQKLALQLTHTILRGAQWTKLNKKTPGCLVPLELPNVSPELERNDVDLMNLSNYRRSFLQVDAYTVLPFKSATGANPYGYSTDEDTYRFSFFVRAKIGKKQGFVACRTGDHCRIVKRSKRQRFEIIVGLGMPNSEQAKNIREAMGRPRSLAVSGLTGMMINSDVIEDLRVLPKKCAR